MTLPINDITYLQSWCFCKEKRTEWRAIPTTFFQLFGVSFNKLITCFSRILNLPFFIFDFNRIYLSKKTKQRKFCKKKIVDSGFVKNMWWTRSKSDSIHRNRRSGYRRKVYLLREKQRGRSYINGQLHSSPANQTDASDYLCASQKSSKFDESCILGSIH